MTLNEGDLFLTGSPQGFGLARDGDIILGKLKEGDQVLDSIEFELIHPELDLDTCY